MLVLTQREVESLLDLDALRDAIARAMADLSAGRASLPPRNAATVPEQEALLAAMPAYLPSAGALTTKLVTVFPRNTDRPTHQAVIAAFDPADGTPIALMDGAAITASRTAAGSALATDLLARKEARVLAIIGTGVQARSHLRAVPRVRSFREIVVAGRDRAKAEALAREFGARAAATFKDAIERADVVCGCTHPHEPVIRGEWLRPGTHVNSVGFDVQGREVDVEAIRRSLVVVEHRASALAAPPAGSSDLLAALREGALTSERVHAELGELVAGTKPGRTSPDQITLYKSVGVAVEDAAAAALVLAAARARGVGTEVSL